MFILPINRDSDTANTPRAVLALIAINCACFLGMMVFSSPAVILRHYGFVPTHPHLLTLFTSMFLHAGWLHILGNMWFLWTFGKDVEESVGAWLFMLMYLLSGLGGGLLHMLFNLHSNVPCVGASGAISGIMGCFLILLPKAEVDLVIYFGWWRLKTIETHAPAAVGTWIGEQTVLGLLTQAVRFSSVAFWGHVGGFMVGLAAGLCFKRLVPLGEDGMPVVRPWYIPEQITKESDAITQLRL